MPSQHPVSDPIHPATDRTPPSDADRFERWYGNSVRTPQVGHFERNLDTGVAAWDAGCRAIWDLAPDLPVPTIAALAERVAPADRERFLSPMHPASGDGSAGDFTVRLQSFAGHWKHVRSVWSRHRSADGMRIVSGNLHDVTEAVLSAQRADLRERQVDLALELAQVGLMELDLESGLLTASDSARRIFDLPPSGPLDLDHVLRRVHPDDQPRLLAEIARARDEPGTVGESRYRLHDQGRVTRRLRVRRTVRVDPDGSTSRLLASVIDETETVLHATRERELSLARELALDVAGLGTFRAVPLGSGWYDFDARQSAIYGLGFEARRLSLPEWLGCIHPDDRSALQDIEDAIQANRMMFGRVRFRIVRPSGDIRWLEVSFRRGDTRPGEPRSLYGTTLDVTDRELAHQRLGALFEHTLSGLVLLDDQARCLDVNPAACAMAGHPRGALLGRPLLQLVRPLPDGREPDVAWRDFLGQGARRGVLTLQRADGRVVTLDYVAVAAIQPGVHLVSLNDATARLTAEARLREVAARQQDDFDEFRAEIARDVHDQLGQTLGVLMFEVGMLGARSGVDASHLQTLLQDAVAVTRELSRTLRPATLDLGLVAALGELASGIVQRTDVDVQVDAVDGLPELPPATVRGIYRIAQEALTNVVKHAGAPRATIRIDRVETAEHVSELRVCVADEGRGFDAARALARHGATGGGLGLLGMSERALQLGGRLQVDSHPGGGCRVVLTLALPRAADAGRDGVAGAAARA